MTLGRFLASLTGPTRNAYSSTMSNHKAAVFAGLSTGMMAEIQRAADKHGLYAYVPFFAALSVELNAEAAS